MTLTKERASLIMSMLYRLEDEFGHIATDDDYIGLAKDLIRYYPELKSEWSTLCRWFKIT